MTERRDYAGAAVATTLASGISDSDTSISIAADTGWPTGSPGPFYIVIDRGNPSEEKVLVDSRTGTTLTVATAGDRGEDDTTATAHTTGASVEVCWTALEADEINEHLNDTTVAESQHSGLLNNARHDLTARHTAGTVVPTAAPSAVGTALTEGNSTSAARANHIHTIGTGAINNANMFAAGVVDAAAIATDAVGSAEIAANAVTSSELADDAVDTNAIADDAVTAAKVADAAIDADAKFATGFRPHHVGTGAPSTPTEGDLWAETDAKRLHIYNGSANERVGWYTSAGRTGCHLTASHASASPGGTVTWEVESQDTDGFISVPGTTITVPAGLGGLYALTVTAVAGVGLGGQYLYVDPDTLPLIIADSPNTGLGQASVSAVAIFPAGETFTVVHNHNGVSSPTIDYQLWFYRIGP
jgi:hypothetical protein